MSELLSKKGSCNVGVGVSQFKTRNDSDPSENSRDLMDSPWEKLKLESKIK